MWPRSGFGGSHSVSTLKATINDSVKRRLGWTVKLLGGYFVGPGTLHVE